MMRWLVFIAVLASGFVLAGCGDGIAITARERRQRQERILENDARQFNDDWDMFMLNDDMGRMSLWRIR